MFNPVLHREKTVYGGMSRDNDIVKFSYAT